MRSTGESQDATVDGMAGPVTELQTTVLRKEPDEEQLSPDQSKQQEVSQKQNVELHAEQQEEPVVESPTRMTRAGRAIKTPAKFKDFIKL